MRTPLRVSLAVAAVSLALTATQAIAAGSLIISEFRLQGLNGVNDEFIEIYNDSGVDHTVAAISGAGYAIAASDGVIRCTIPNGTVIPARGHWLCVNSNGYGLGTYPAGNGTNATGDGTYTLDIPINAGLALFNNTTGGGSFSLVNRFDARGTHHPRGVREGHGFTDGRRAAERGEFLVRQRARPRDRCFAGGEYVDEFVRIRVGQRS